jgi:NitT/TauT family transport system substrate-binding protein
MSAAVRARRVGIRPLLGLSLLLALSCGAPARPAPGSSDAAAPAAGASAASAGAAAAPPRELRELKIGLISRTFTSLPHWIAEQLGYFAEEGLVLEDIYTSASTAAIAALVSGTVDLTGNSPSNVILARQQGANLIMVGGIQNRAMYYMVGLKEYRSLDDLRGKRIGAAGTSTGDAVLIRAMMGAHGLRERDDYTLLRIGGTPDRYSALLAGAIDAVTLIDPFSYAAYDAGLSDLGAAYDYVPEFQGTATNVQAEWARQNESAVVGFQKALIRGIRWAYDPANREAALRIAVEQTGIERRYAEMAMDAHVQQSVWPRDGAINEPGLAWVITQAAAVGEIEPPLPLVSDVVDQSYTRKALAQLDGGSRP